MQVNTAATSTTSIVSFTVTYDAVNPTDVQLVQITTSQPVLVHYQSHNDPWLSAPQANAPSVPSAAPVSNSLPSISFEPTVSSFSIPPHVGQPPHMITMPRNPLPFPGPLPSIPNIQKTPPQFRANPSVGPPFGQPPGIVNPQVTPSSSMPSPVRLILVVGGTARPRWHGSGTRRQGWRLPEPSGITHTRARPGGIARTTACCWGRWAVVTRRLVIDPFELKFDRLNTNSTV
jgi:hypothetical protein